MINIQDIIPFMKDGWENAQLKELLKECKDVAEFTKTIVNKHKWLDGVIAKINQALGEDK